MKATTPKILLALTATFVVMVAHAQDTNYVHKYGHRMAAKAFAFNDNFELSDTKGGLDYIPYGHSGIGISIWSKFFPFDIAYRHEVAFSGGGKQYKKSGATDLHLKGYCRFLPVTSTCSVTQVSSLPTTISTTKKRSGTMELSLQTFLHRISQPWATLFSTMKNFLTMQDSTHRNSKKSQLVRFSQVLRSTTNKSKATALCFSAKKPISNHGAWASTVDTLSILLSNRNFCCSWLQTWESTPATRNSNTSSVATRKLPLPYMVKPLSGSICDTVPLALPPRWTTSNKYLTKIWVCFKTQTNRKWFS